MKQLSFLAPSPDSLNVKPTRWRIYVDGASRGNPGLSGAGVYISSEDDDIMREGFYLGKKTNNQAEYLALALALYFTKLLVAKRKMTKPCLTITSDSLLLIQQMRGIYKVKNPELKRIKKYIDLLKSSFSCTFRHVLREKNTIADELANLGVDSRNSMPFGFTQELEKVT